MDNFVLTDENYYTPQADRLYMSCSQYQDFLKCEAGAMAKIHGLYVPEQTEALIVGNYLHTALESDTAHERFCEQHFDDIFKTKTDKKTGEISITGKYAAYEKADSMISAIRNDPMISKIIAMPGENEVIVTGELFGMKWKARFDKYCRDKRLIIDWKTAADLSRTEYNPATGERESFIEFLGYMMRAAVYSELEKQTVSCDDDPKFVIVSVSKQEPPDKGAFMLNDRQRYDYELDEIKRHMERIRMVKETSVKPKRCGRCEWCRMTKKLAEVLPYYVLTPGFQKEREDEYDKYYSEYRRAYMEEIPQA